MKHSVRSISNMSLLAYLPSPPESLSMVSATTTMGLLRT